MHTDILIVGGGLSGLALADRLERQGRDWLLTEARDRLGGRILSPDIAGAHFDLGLPGSGRVSLKLSRCFAGSTSTSLNSFRKVQPFFRTGPVLCKPITDFPPWRGPCALQVGMARLDRRA